MTDCNRITAACPVCGDELRTRDLAGALQWLTLWHRHSAVEHAAALVVKRAGRELADGTE